MASYLILDPDSADQLDLDFGQSDLLILDALYVADCICRCTASLVSGNNQAVLIVTSRASAVLVAGSLAAVPVDGGLDQFSFDASGAVFVGDSLGRATLLATCEC